MPRRAAVRGKTAVHWWSNEIAELRKAAIAARRRYQRWTQITVELARRSDLKRAIRKAQEESWKKLCLSVDNDPWGVPYRVVTKRLGRRAPAFDRDTAANVARGLFPSPPPTDWDNIPLVNEELAVLADISDVTPLVPLVTTYEVERVVARLPTGKAPGPDRVPNEIIRLAFKRFPEEFVDCYNACLTGVNPTLEDIAGWMSSNGLQLAPEKSECVVLTNKKAYRAPNLSLQGCQVPVKKVIRYLGVRLDTRLSFVDHIGSAAAGAKKAAAALGRLMPNVGGPSQAKRSLLMSVVHSRLLYGAAVWSESALKTQKNKNMLLQAQRCAAFKVARCYRTVSDMASLVLARMPPAFLQADNRRNVVAAKTTGAVLLKRETTARMISSWQEVWDSTSKAAWTRRLIPDLSRWYRGPRAISFHMAQALTGHGCFQQYLWARSRAHTPACFHCPAEVDDVEHTLFICMFWNAERRELVESLRQQARPEDVMDLLCEPVVSELPVDPQQRMRILETARKRKVLFMKMVEDIIGRKEEWERARQRFVAEA
ncbi:hypothetical protein AGLY_003400 [Aphis glycines]|uniref:Reverse transcriptase zinc-binding domain-containing protein n=1 Tax=Aphis glycines TaxID=307491 RepID=A0A6G0U010_APHGL|nr:hypothetical protein AGLY_003400 [Aphis glycines]